MAHAHICAERALASGGEVAEKAAGQVTFNCFQLFSNCNCSQTEIRENDKFIVPIYMRDRMFTYSFNFILIGCPIKINLSKLRSSILKVCFYRC